MKSVHYLLLIAMLAAAGMPLQAQEIDPTTTGLLQQYAGNYQRAVHRKLDQFDKRLLKTQNLFLKKLQRHHNRLRKVKDTTGVFTVYDRSMKQLLEQPAQAAGKSTTYIAYLDTLQSGLGFLEKIPGVNTLNANNELMKNVKTHLGEIEQLGALLKQQQSLLQQLGQRYKKEATAYLQSVSKEYYYFSETLKNYKELLSNPSKAEEKLLTVLRELPAFQSFLQKHSALAGLFSIPGGDPGSLAGLQTRQLLQQIVFDKTAASSMNPTAMLAGQVQSARSKLDELKQHITGSNTADAALPDFKPRDVKSKTFLQRVELGSQLKFTGRSNFLPVRSELNLSAGYRFSDKMSMGIGMTHWLGLGNGIRQISFSHQGMGLTSYYRMQFKKTFFISGGYERNYFTSFAIPGDVAAHDGWKNSALLGIGKKIPLGRSFLKGKWGGDRMKTSTIALLYDFLYRQQLPQTEAIKLRFGLGF